MSRKLLLFGFEELPTILAAAAAAGPFGAEVVPVARQDYNKPLAVLAGLDDDPGTVLPFNGGPLGGRMVVLCGLEDQVDCLLPALRQAGIGRDCLKAVLTPHNRTWTAVKLYQELLREHQAMNGRSEDADPNLCLSAGGPLSVRRGLQAPALDL